MGLIYCAYNKITKKSYIGMTTKSLKDRIDKHYAYANSYRKNAKFQNTLLKYDKNDFEWSILLNNVNDLEELMRYETMYINLFDTIKNGYNTTLGGFGFRGKHTKESKIKMSKSNSKPNPKRRKDIVMFNENGDIIGEFKGIQTASDITKINRKSISNNLNKISNYCRYKKKQGKSIFCL
jgi:hypothetical protein